jgi:cobalt-zinc-cadmium efflux system outer membrane protein
VLIPHRLFPASATAAADCRHRMAHGRGRLRPLACVLAIFFTATPLWALSPDQAVELALARPDVIQRFQTDIDLARADLIEARTWANPEILLSHEDPDSPVDGPTETSVLLAQEFQLGGRRRLARAAAELGITAAQAGADAARAALRAEVLDHYYTVLAGERIVADVSAYRDRLARLAEVAERRRAAGDLSGYESRRIAQLDQTAQARLALTQADTAAARGRLEGLIAEPVPPLTDAVNLAPAPPSSLASLTAQLDQATELRALDRRRDATTAALTAAERLALPVTIGIGQKRFGGGGGAGDNALLLEVSVPLPLFDRNQAAIARASAQAADADARYAQMRALADARLRALWQQADGLAVAAERMRRDDIAYTSELTRIALLSFEAGELDLVGLIDALDADLQARERVLDLELRARRAAIELNLLTQGDLP